MNCVGSGGCYYGALLGSFARSAKKYRTTELVRCGAATGETFGTMMYIFAEGSNPTLTAPIPSSDCLVATVLARIFPKERLTRRQHLNLAFVVIGIVLLGNSEILTYRMVKHE